MTIESSKERDTEAELDRISRLTLEGFVDAGVGAGLINSQNGVPIDLESGEEIVKDKNNNPDIKQ